MRKNVRWIETLAWLLALCLAAPLQLLARYQPSHGWDAFSRDDEVKIGQQAAAETSHKLPLLPESDPITRYVQRLGQDLAAHAPGEKWPFSFRVVNQKEINAFALPGGPIYVNLGTIQAADNEAQLAGVMAHEISHVVQRHATRAASKQMMAQMPLAILGGLLGRGALGQLAQLGISFGAGSYFLRNSRQAESEADLLGADIMYDSGYNPQAMSDFFAKLDAEGGARGPQFFSDHPNPGNRAPAVTREVSSLPRKNYRTQSAAFASTKQLVAGMKPLTAQQIAAQQPTQPGNSMGRLPSEDLPNGRLRPYQHSSFQVSYPENWQVLGDNNSSLTIAPRSGVSQNAIAYGVMVSGYTPEDPSATLDQSTHQLINSLRQSNSDLRVVGHDENIRINGVAGKSVDLISTSPIEGQTGRSVQERDWLVTLRRSDGSLLYLVFIAPDQDFNSLRPTYEQMLKTLRLR